LKKKDEVATVRNSRTVQNANKRGIAGIRKIGGSDEQARWAMQIYRECGNDFDAVLMVEGESGFVLTKRSNKPNNNGTFDWGLFQFTERYRSHFLFDGYGYPDNSDTAINKAWRKFVRNGGLTRRPKFSKYFYDVNEQIKYGCYLWRNAKPKGYAVSPWYAYRNIARNPEARADITKRFIITYK